MAALTIVLLGGGCARANQPGLYEPERDLQVRVGDTLPVGFSPAGKAVSVRFTGGSVHDGGAFVARQGIDTLVAVDDAGRRVETRLVTGVPRPAPGNYALRFTGTGSGDVDRLKIRVDGRGVVPHRGADIGAGDFTIEFWVRARRGDNARPAVECGANVAWIGGNILLDRDRYNAGRKFGLSVAGGLPVFGVTGNENEHRTICSDRRIDDGSWHHVAVTRAGPRLRMFVDGAVAAEADDGPAGDLSYPDGAVPGDYCHGPCVRSDPFLVIGAEKHDVGSDYPPFTGDLDELRLSTVVRYATSFAAPSQAFSLDSVTAALYHFDEGSGDLAADAAGGVRGSPGFLHRGGAAMAPLWIVSDAPSGVGTP